MLLKCFLVSHVKNSSHQIKNKYLFLLLSTLCKKKKNKENSSTSISLLLLHSCSELLVHVHLVLLSMKKFVKMVSN